MYAKMYKNMPNKKVAQNVGIFGAIAPYSKNAMGFLLNSPIGEKTASLVTLLLNYLMLIPIWPYL
jgi:hypothetical protein